MLTLAEVKSYLGINSTADDALLQSLMKAADEYLKGAVSATYDVNSERAKMLSLIVISDLYDNQGMNDKVSGTVRKLVNDFTLQLKLESSVVV